MSWIYILQILVGGTFLVITAVIILQITKRLGEWSTNNSLPVLSVPARVVAKRTATNGQMSSNAGGMVSTSYFATFELASGDRLEFSLYGKGYGLLVERDEGTLTYQGTRYHGFQRQIQPSAASDPDSPGR